MFEIVKSILHDKARITILRDRTYFGNTLYTFNETTTLRTGNFHRTTQTGSAVIKFMVHIIIPGNAIRAIGIFFFAGTRDCISRNDIRINSAKLNFARLSGGIWNLRRAIR